MSICSLRWFAEDMLGLSKWAVCESADEVKHRVCRGFWKALECLDTHVQPSHVRRGWDGMLAEEAVERVRAEARGDTEVVEPPTHWYHEDSVAASATDGPTGVEVPPPLPPPVGPPPSELVDLIAEVLADHEVRVWGGVEPIRCFVRTGAIHASFKDWASWRAHLAELIAERIEKATPPTPFTHGDLIEAEHIAMFYAAEFCMDGGAEQARIRALATRLGDAGHADPTP